MFREYGVVSFPVVLAITSGFAQGQPATAPDFFESKIRPILSANCYACHTNSALGGLRVDSSEGLLKGGKRGTAIVPGDPENSLLIKAIKHLDDTYKMPMGGKLKDADIEALIAWVKAGAVWPKTNVALNAPAKDGNYVIRPEQRNFWSFVPLTDPAPPTLKDAKWPKTSIDRFVLAKLQEKGIKPAPPAAKRDLIRRATLDLTGLPATYDEIQAFEKDINPNAFAKVVDRLLDSPHYGERWGRMWLDVARYGEDDYRSLDPMRRGHNPYPNAHIYRDWVIQAMNDDLPFDQFVRYQLAGDLMDPKIHAKTLPATGFLGLGPWYYDNGSTEVTRADERHDRVDVVSRGFLGVTVACARCHDHKYDPIPAKDYYALAGVFSNTIYEEYPLIPKSALKKYRDAEEQVDQKEKILDETRQNVSAQLARSLAVQTSNYLMGVFEVTGKEKKDKAQVVEARKLDYELLDRWIRYMDRKTEKYAHKNAWQAMMKSGGSTDEATKLAHRFQEAVVSVMLEQEELKTENKVISAKALDGTKPKKRTNKPSNFVTNEDFCPGCNLQLKAMPEDRNALWTEIFQRELTDNDDPVAMMAMGFRNMKPGVLVFRGWGLESRSGSEVQAQMASMKKDIEDSKKKLEPEYPYLHGVRDAERPTNLPLAKRGYPFNLGDEVPRHFLSVLSKSDPASFSKGSGRLELADRILEQPVALRVYVNRIWKAHFGTGIVDTPSNFGQTGERPTNPELLEYLASNFKKNGLSTKKLHREIMLSAVYQLGTDNDTGAYEKDSANRLYWRTNRKRMDSEQLRDSVLAVSGSLDTALGGPSKDLRPDMLRRTVYGKVSRYKLDEYLQLFDFPSPLISAEKRFTTTVPLQRLFLMNSDFMQIQAEELAKRVAAEADNPARIRKLYQLALGRAPTPAEVNLGLEYIKTEPLREYEERKKKKEEEANRKPEKPEKTEGEKPESKDAMPTTDLTAATPAVAAKPAGAEIGGTEAPAEPPPGVAAMGMGPMGMGMMGGMGRRGPGGAAPPEIKYEPTAWGRYAKVLLSSSEFLFIN